MPVLGAGDPLPRRPQRVLVAGTSGAGKTTLARAVSGVLGCPHVELDSLHHGPGWTKRPSFEDDVRRVVGGASWVSEWQYAAVRETLLPRADLLVWLDLPRRVVMARVVRLTTPAQVSAWVAGPLLASAYRRPQLPGGCAPGPGGGPQDPDGG